MIHRFGDRARGWTITATVIALVVGCGGGNGPAGPGQVPGEEILAFGVARNDVSPRDRLEGFLVFFYDLDRQVLLEADAEVNQTSVATVIEPGIIPGPIYVAGADIQPGTSYGLAATVGGEGSSVEVSSALVSAPAEFAIEVPIEHPIGEPMTVRWDPVTGATGINVAAGSGFEVDLPVTATSATVPVSAFAGLSPGTTIEIEVTAYDTFYVSLSAGISELQDAEAFVDRFADVDNVTGARGAFGAATSVGAIVTLR